MTVLKGYVLRLFISIKFITANVVDRNNGRIVATASTAERAIKEFLECGGTCNAKATYVVGEVLAMRLNVEGLMKDKEEAFIAEQIERDSFGIQKENQEEFRDW